MYAYMYIYICVQLQLQTWGSSIKVDTTMETKLGRKRLVTMGMVERFSLIQSMVVVTSPIGVHTPPALAETTCLKKIDKDEAEEGLREMICVRERGDVEDTLKEVNRLIDVERHRPSYTISSSS